MVDIKCFIVHTEENQSFIVNTETIEEAINLVRQYGYTFLGYDNIFIPSNNLQSVENILM